MFNKRTSRAVPIENLPRQPTDNSESQSKDSPTKRASQQSRQGVVMNMVRRTSTSIATLKNPSTDSEELSKPAVYHSAILGVLLALASSAVLSLVNVIIKRLPSVSTLEVLTFMAFGVFIGILPAATDELDPFGSRQAQPLLITRTILSLLASLLRLSSLSYLSVADASIVASLTPLTVSLTALVFFSEQFHWTQGVAVGSSIFGLALLTKPPFLSSGGGFLMGQFIGIGYGLAHTALNGVTTVCIRAIKGVSRKVVVFHYGCLSMLLVSVLSVATNKMKIFYEGSQIGYLLLISHLTFATQMFLTKALQVESASVVIIIKTASDVVFGFVLQVAFLTDWPDYLSITGAMFITGGVALLGFRKVVVNAAEESKVRKRFNFLI